MYLSLLGVYLYPHAKGFYIGKLGDEVMDTSLLGLHWEQYIVEEEDMMYTSLSFDICYLALMRSTIYSFIDMLKGKDKDKEE